MKKTRLTALMLVVSLMLTGAVYAAWNQTIPVTMQVSTGELAVEVTEASVVKLVHQTGFEDENGEPVVAEMSADENNGDSITIEGSNMYPGTVGQVRLVFKNTGSIPADLNVDNIDSDMPVYMLYGLVGRKVEIFDENDPNNPAEVIRTKKKNYESIDDLFNGKKGIGDITLTPGQAAEMVLSITFHGKNDEDDMEENKGVNGSEPYELTFDIEVSQYNID